MTDQWETVLLLLAAGGRSIEPGSPARADEPPSEAAGLVELDHLWANGIDGHGEPCQVDLLPTLPAEVLRWLARQEGERYMAESRDAATPNRRKRRSA